MRRVPRAAPEIVASGELVTLAPAVLTVAAAAAFLGCSASLLNTARSADARRLERGEPIEGPQWVRLSYGIRYKVSDLEAYLQRTAVPGGVMEGRRRGRAGETAGGGSTP
jgi:hypothetical protein